MYTHIYLKLEKYLKKNKLLLLFTPHDMLVFKFWINF